jgi:hypothetical protein
VPAFAQQLQTLRAPGVTPKPKGPLVFLDGGGLAVAVLANHEVQDVREEVDQIS